MTLNVRLQPSLVPVRLVIPPEMRNPLVKDPLALFQVYIDEIPIPEAELRTLRFGVAPGKHVVWVITGGFLFEIEYVFSPGVSYILQPSYELKIEPERPAR